MKKADLEQILEAFDDIARLLQYPTFPAFLRDVCKRGFEELNKVRKARTREGLEAMLTKEPDLSPEQLKANIEQIRNLPYLMRKIIPLAAKEAAKRFPRDPGGRRKKIKQEEYPKICKEIATLLGQVMDLKIAKQRVAQRHGVGARTIERVWSEHKKRVREGSNQQSS